MMFETLQTYFMNAAQGDFFAGGLALGLSGAVLGALTLLWTRTKRFVTRRVMFSVTISNHSSAYRHLMLWLEDKAVLSHVRQVQVTDVWRKGGMLYGPAPGTHWFMRQGRLCLFTRSVNAKTQVGNYDQRKPMETVTVTVLFGSVSLIKSWIAEGAQIANKAARLGPKIHILKEDYWDSLGEVPGRALETVLADDDRVERLAADVRRFLGAREWYADRGVPWRRGYLLYGPPGTGKSSAIRAIATDLNLDIATLDLGRVGLTDDALREAMVSAPRNAILAIEDIDAVFRARKSGEKTVGVSFSGLLNAIDGVAAQEGRALFMTTNHLDQLDPALIRPGRADIHVELGPVSAATAARLFARFFPEEGALQDVFKDALGDLQITPAALQGWLLEHAEDAQTASTAAGLVAEYRQVGTPLMAAE